MRRKIDEMRAGYNNAQELIRFIDTKLALISGLCCAVIAGFYNICFELYKTHFHNALTGRSLLELMFVFLFIALSISTQGVTLFGIWARKQQNGATSSLPHILFPIGNTPDFGAFKQQVNSRTEDDEYAEVCCQLYSVGIILEKKINMSRISFLFFVAQVLSASALYLIKNL